MAYTIVKSDGTVLTTIPDGTINTTSTSVALPGRNYPGYGQPQDTNFVHIVENFAASTPPPRPLRGQLWYNTNNSTLYVCPTDGQSNSLAWLSLTSTSSAGNTTFGNVTVTGNITAANVTATNLITAPTATISSLTVSTLATVANLVAPLANITTTLTATAITSGSATTAGTLTGTWTLNGTSGSGANALILNTGGIYISNAGGNIYGIRTDKYMYANGADIPLGSSYGNSNVTSFLPTYVGSVGAVGQPSIFNGNTLTTGESANAGTITGNWTLTAGSRLLATYADLAERFSADDLYDAGTVVEIGGTQEITAVKYELSDDVFGVISNTAAYLMNSGAGTDSTHPPVAVSGRVAVKVVGIVKKGQRLVSAGNGIARAATTGEATAFNTIGRALADKLTDDIGTVEAIVMIR